MWEWFPVADVCRTLEGFGGLLSSQPSWACCLLSEKTPPAPHTSPQPAYSNLPGASHLPHV